MPVPAGPETPTESNLGAPIGGISYWWRVIGDWIKLLSPAGASQYDTDWVSITPNTGYTGNVSIRRIGKVVWIRGTLARTAGDFSVTNESVFTIPSGYRPTLFLRNTLPRYVSSAAGTLVASFATSGIVQVGATGASTGEAYFNQSWPVD